MSNTTESEDCDQRYHFLTIDGLKWFSAWNSETLHFARNYRARPDDLFVVTYPKSGTTWMVSAVYTLLTKGQPFDQDRQDFFERTPYLELESSEAVLNQRRPGLLKTHIPINMLSVNPQSKYICVVRNPKDVCISYFMFFRTWAYAPKLDFDEFFEYFMEDRLPFNDYFECLQAIWERRNEPNVCLVSYEEMKSDIQSVIKKVAAFINVDLSEELLEKTVRYSSYDYMKGKYDDERRIFEANVIKNMADARLATQMQKIFELESNLKMVRKGEINDWKLHMTQEQSQKVFDRFKELCRSCEGLEDYWSKWNIF